MTKEAVRRIDPVADVNLRPLFKGLRTPDATLSVVKHSKDEVQDIMGAPCAQEIPGWQGTGKSPSLSEPTQ